MRLPPFHRVLTPSILCASVSCGALAAPFLGAAQLYLDVPPARVKLDEPISTYGEHSVPISIDGDVSASLKLFVRQ